MIISLVNLKYKDKECDRDNYNIKKAAQHIATATQNKATKDKKKQV